MKKTNVARTAAQPKTEKKLFGIAKDKLQTVCGGGGVIDHGNVAAPAPTLG